jgi:nucleotide-binding universal stress UspA family protein
MLQIQRDYQKLEDVRHQYFMEVNNKVTDGLEVFIKEKNIEMIALVAHQYNFFDRLFHRSVTKQVSKLADIPLLVMHE